MTSHRHYEWIYRERQATLHPDELWLACDHPQREPSGSSPNNQLGNAQHDTELELSADISHSETGYHRPPFMNIGASSPHDIVLQTTQLSASHASSSHAHSIEGPAAPTNNPRCSRYNLIRSRFCFEGHSSCQNCSSILGLGSLRDTILDIPYLDGRRWAGFSDNVVADHIGSSNPSKNPTTHNEIFILSLWFEDRIRGRDLSEASFTTLELSLSKESYDPLCLVQGDDKEPGRPPAISLERLDNFILEEMVRTASLAPEKYEPGEEGTELLRRLALFTGYHGLLCNLGTTWFDTSAFVSHHACRIAAAEFVFALVWQLDVRFVKFAEFIHEILSQLKPEKSPALAFYSLEYVHRMLHMQRASWNISAANTSSALNQLENEFNHRSQVILDRVLTYECAQLKLHGRRGTGYKLPPSLNLTRPTGETRLPIHLSVTARQHSWLRTMLEPFPVPDIGLAKWSIIDILRDANESLTTDIIEGRMQPRKRFPGHIIENDSTSVVLSLSNIPHAIDEDITNASKTSTGGPTYNSTLNILPELRLPRLSSMEDSPEKDETTSLYSHTSETWASETFQDFHIEGESDVELDTLEEWDSETMTLFTAEGSHPEAFVPFGYGSAF